MNKIIIYEYRYMDKIGIAKCTPKYYISFIYNYRYIKIFSFKYYLNQIVIILSTYV